MKIFSIKFQLVDFEMIKMKILTPSYPFTGLFAANFLLVLSLDRKIDPHEIDIPIHFFTYRGLAWLRG